MTWFAMIQRIPEKGRGLYSVWAGDQLLYIGLSIQLRGRLVHHERLAEFIAGGATHVEFMLIADKKARHCAEEWLIDKHRPPLNRGKARSKWGYLHSEKRLLATPTIQ
jgi:hypothetical protein